MSKTEFLSLLERQLSTLSEEERQKCLAFYAESIDDRIEDGMAEEEAVKDLGSIQTIAQNIMVEQPLPVLVKAKIKKSRDRMQNQSLFIVLAILGSPLWIPLLFGAGMLLLAVYIVIWSLLFSLYLVAFAFACCGIGGLFAGLLHLYISGVPAGLMILGVSMFSAGAFLLALSLLRICTKKTIDITVALSKKIKRLFVSKKEAQ